MEHGLNTDKQEWGLVELAPPNIDGPLDPGRAKLLLSPIFVPFRKSVFIPCSIRG